MGKESSEIFDFIDNSSWFSLGRASVAEVRGKTLLTQLHRAGREDTKACGSDRANQTHTLLSQQESMDAALILVENYRRWSQTPRLESCQIPTSRLIGLFRHVLYPNPSPTMWCCVDSMITLCLNFFMGKTWMIIFGWGRSLEEIKTTKNAPSCLNS